MSDLENPEDQFSRVAPQMSFLGKFTMHHKFNPGLLSSLARLHEVHRAIVVTSVVPVYVYVYVLLKFFISLYLLTMLMDQVDTLHVARYWSEVLRSTIMTHPG